MSESCRMEVRMNGKADDREERLFAQLRRFIARAKADCTSGFGQVRFQFHQGGITGKEFEMTWLEK